MINAWDEASANAVRLERGGADRTGRHYKK
jgi:hypothetical protein